MSLPTLTPELLKQLFERDKPHLLVIEEEAKRLEYGQLEIVFKVRAGVIDSMEIMTKIKNWKREVEKKGV